MPRYNIANRPLGYQMRNRDPERAMATGAQSAIQRYVKRAQYNEKRRKSNGGMGG